MHKHIRILLAGMLMVAPFAVTIWLIYAIATSIGGLGLKLFESLGLQDWASKHHLQPYLSLAGSLVLIAFIYLLGLMTKFWLFRRLIKLVEGIFQRVPGVKTIYESIRDLLKLFGTNKGQMGKVVLYRPAGGQMAMLGILTNEKPAALAKLDQNELVAVYLPLAYMVGGPVVYVPRNDLQELDLPVEQALKICATAEICQAPSTTPITIIDKVTI